MGDDGTPGGVARSQVRILIVDDEPFMLHLHAHMLAALGFGRVATCTSGAEALARVEPGGNGAADAPDPPGQGVPNLILLDLNMPQMDGIEFVRKLVERRYTGSLVLVSGEDERMLQMAEKLVRAHQITVLGHLRKPVAPADLSRVMEKWRPATGQASRKTYGADEVRAALANDELFNHYQPKVDVATGALVGVETLVRWRHPRDGLVMPGRFVDVAEEHGLIDALTRGVLTRAMAQARRWRADGLPLRVAVNVSMHNLTSPAFADFVSEAAGLAGVAPQDIVLEVTESRLMLDQRGPLEILIRLRLKRFRLSIDDFGTGHSSLTQLHDISFDELKIDQSFVHGAWRDATVRAMFDASLHLGKQLGMDVVAEGVEDQDDWDLVRRSGCDLAQGYFIARPMPAEDLPAWIALWDERKAQLANAGGA